VFHESLGFPAAFLGAGAAGVIASLWAVDDLSTSLLMEKVYEFMLSRDRLRPPGALQRASRWLRCLPKHEVLTQLAFHIARLESALRNHEHLSEETFYAIHYQLRVTRARLIEVQNGSDRPFDDPFYWAAFAAYGV
jgi:CHAT domain-containing protein